MTKMKSVLKLFLILLSLSLVASNVEFKLIKNKNVTIAVVGNPIITNGDDFVNDPKPSNPIIIYTRRSWHEAKVDCLKRKKRLVSILDQRKQNKIRELVFNSPHFLETDSFWTSGADLKNGKGWYWYGAGRKISYTHWGHKSYDKDSRGLLVQGTKGIDLLWHSHFNQYDLFWTSGADLKDGKGWYWYGAGRKISYTHWGHKSYDKNSMGLLVQGVNGIDLLWYSNYIPNRFYYICE